MKTDAIRWALLERKHPQMTRAPAPLHATAEQKALHEAAQRRNREDREAYAAQLAAMPILELLALHQTEIEAPRRAREALEESQRFYNRSDALVEPSYWGVIDYWTPEEATALSFGKNPRVVNLESVKSTIQLYAFCRQYSERCEIFTRGAQTGKTTTLKTWHPREWIAWGEPRGITFPPELIAKLPPILDKMATPPAPAPERALPPLGWMDISDLFKLFPGKRKASDPIPSRWKKAIADSADRAKWGNLADAIEIPGKPGSPAMLDPEAVAHWIVSRDEALKSKVARALCDHIKSLKDPAYDPIAARWQPFVKAD